MKPDQHKIKKNNEYKKKHGIKNEKQQVLEKKVILENGRRVMKSPSKEIKVERNSRNANSTKTDKTKKNAAGSLPSSDESDHESQKSHFSRRKLESNWQKYELDIDASEETLKGADYNELVQSYKHILPEYQFGRTHAIEVEPLTDENGKNALVNYLTLDCERLSAAARCIPLHIRLDIEESFFQESRLETFIQEAAVNMCTYRRTYDVKDRLETDGISNSFVSMPSCNNHLGDRSVSFSVVSSSQDTEALVTTNDSQVMKNCSEPEESLPIHVSSALEVSKIHRSSGESGTSRNIFTEEKSDVSPISTDVGIHSEFEPTVSVAEVIESITAAVGSLNHPSLAELEDDLESLLSI